MTIVIFYLFFQYINNKSIFVIFQVTNTYSIEGGENVVLSDWELSDLGGGRKLFGRGVALFSGTSFSWENDQLNMSLNIEVTEKNKP